VTGFSNFVLDSGTHIEKLVPSPRFSQNKDNNRRANALFEDSNLKIFHQFFLYLNSYLKIQREGVVAPYVYLLSIFILLFFFFFLKKSHF
jgi:hypothetical protein